MYVCVLSRTLALAAGFSLFPFLVFVLAEKGGGGGGLAGNATLGIFRVRGQRWCFCFSFSFQSCRAAGTPVYMVWLGLIAFGLSALLWENSL